MRFLRLMIPVVALFVMLFSQGNQTGLRVSYGLFALAGVLFVWGFVSGIVADKRRPKTPE